MNESKLNEDLVRKIKDKTTVKVTHPLDGSTRVLVKVGPVVIGSMTMMDSHWAEDLK